MTRPIAGNLLGLILVFVGWQLFSFFRTQRHERAAAVATLADLLTAGRPQRHTAPVQDLLLAPDLGTQSVRALLFAPDGRPSRAASSYSTTTSARKRAG